MNSGEFYVLRTGRAMGWRQLLVLACYAAALVGLVFLLAGCSKYNVKKAEAPGRDIAIGQLQLVTVPAKGPWVWRRTPEEVVTALVNYTQSIGSALHACQAQVEKLAPKKKK